MLLKNAKDPNEPRIGTYVEKSMEIHMEQKKHKIRKKVEKTLKDAGFTDEDITLGRAKATQREAESSGLRRSGRNTFANLVAATKPGKDDKGNGSISSKPTTRSKKRKETPLVAPTKRGKKEKEMREKNMSVIHD